MSVLSLKVMNLHGAVLIALEDLAQWSCLDVDYAPTCQSWQQFEFNDARVVSKESCAGELYMTVVLANNTDQVVAHCEGAEIYSACQSVEINQTVHVIVDLGCDIEKNWIFVD